MVTLQLDKGLRIIFDKKAVFLDSSSSSDVTCITHAHLDHWRGAFGLVIMTNETFHILRAREIRINNHLTSNYGEAITPLENIQISSMNSGHMLGSCLFKINAQDEEIVYTGDLNTVETILEKPAEVVEAKDLLIEATYGTPLYKFGPRERIYAQITKWVVRTLKDGFIPCFKVYTAGKAQEIIAIINSLLNVDVILSPDVYKVSLVYKKTYPWMSFEPINSINTNEIIRNGEFVYVTASMSPRIFTPRRTKWAIATGWALSKPFPQFDAAFPLSSHADFKGLVDYVEAVSPERVITTCGHSVTLAKFLRNLGYKAFALEEKQRVKL